MKIFTLIVIISVMIFPGISKTYAQTKLTLETTQFPAGFYGDDIEVLYKNIDKLLKQNVPAGKPTEEILKGKPIYKNRTIDDLFAFELSPTDQIYGQNKTNDKIKYAVCMFPLESLADFPAPKPDEVASLSMINWRPVSSPDDLISEFTNQPPDKFWTSHYLPVETIIPPVAQAKKYVGIPDDRYFPAARLTVPSPQIHYGIAFANKQPFSPVNIGDGHFSLKSYRREPGPGLAVWLYNGREYNGNIQPIFIVKLSAPYRDSKSFQDRDPVEKKPHQAARNLLYADLLAIWLYNPETGEIISKNGDKVR